SRVEIPEKVEVYDTGEKPAEEIKRVEVVEQKEPGFFAKLFGAKEEAEKLSIQKPIVLGVTVLTSMGVDDLGVIGMRGTTRETVLRLATLGKESGLDGIISSAQEIKVVREYFGKDFVILTPGIRPLGNEVNDQKRIATPAEAVKSGADFLVVGRPITAATSPKEAVFDILKEIEEAEKK
ncbi:MAG: orotidine-5'-phosphate decarboxylase, partial [Acidobacteria bacterium]|nr:orotidine-5'-phosphate decarboxylase [Acidobacteriota bacterium]